MTKHYHQVILFFYPMLISEQLYRFWLRRHQVRVQVSIKSYSYVLYVRLYVRIYREFYTDSATSSYLNLKWVILHLSHITPFALIRVNKNLENMPSKFQTDSFVMVSVENFFEGSRSRIFFNLCAVCTHSKTCFSDDVYITLEFFFYIFLFLCSSIFLHHSLFYFPFSLICRNIFHDWWHM